MSQTAVIFYHAGCVDGAMAAAVATKYLLDHPSAKRGDAEILEVKYAPASYHRTPEEVLAEAKIDPKDLEGSQVYVLDFSFSQEHLQRLASIVGPSGVVLVIDHHKTAFDKYRRPDDPPTLHIIQHTMRPTSSSSEICVCIDTSACGALLTWEEFYGSKKPPRILEHVNDYDMWEHKLPESKAVHAYLRSLNMNVPDYVKIFSSGLDGITRIFSSSEGVLQDIYKQGEAILRANQQQAIMIAKRAQKVTIPDGEGVWSNHYIFEVNSPVHQDDIGEMCYEREGGPGLAAIWYWTGKHFKVSLRSNVHDCAAIAQHYSGGGHRASASFICDRLPWTK